jgi:hypothetical protein
MAQGKNVAIKSYNAKILSTLDGKMRKVTNSADKHVWIPTSVGMTRVVGGSSH